MSKKPFKNNFSDLEWESYPAKGRFGSEDKLLTANLRARNLDCALTRLAPGQVSCPYHYHHVDEELFIVLEGHGRLRMDGEEVAIGPQDVIACPPGPSGAHQIINDGTEPLVYLAISTESPLDVCEYPDSDKVMVILKDAEDVPRGRMFKRGTTVDYWEGETGETGQPQPR